MSSRTRPDRPGVDARHWINHDGCTRCEKLLRDLDRLRTERNGLLVKLYDLEHGDRDRGSAPDFPDLPEMVRTPRIPPPADGFARRPQRASARRSQSLPPMDTRRFEGAPLDFAEPDRTPARADGRNPPSMPAPGGVMSRNQGLDFGAVARLSPEELDGLPYGLITLDAEGRVIHYNDTESRLAGLPPERVIGRNFFEEIAPCTRVREFEGRFRELARDPTGVRVQSFDFSFGFAHSEQHVSIIMTPARRRGQYHLALVRRSIRAR